MEADDILQVALVMKRPDGSIKTISCRSWRRPLPAALTAQTGLALEHRGPDK